MRFLAGESCDFSVVRALRAEGHDVMAIAEVSPREEDDDVRERAVKDNRLLITEDKDFVSWYMRTCAFGRSHPYSLSVPRASKPS